MLTHSRIGRLCGSLSLVVFEELRPVYGSGGSGILYIRGLVLTGLLYYLAGSVIFVVLYAASERRLFWLARVLDTSRSRAREHGFSPDSMGKY